MSDHKERLEQSLSALMDGEATEMETHRLLKAVAEDPHLRRSVETLPYGLGDHQR